MKNKIQNRNWVDSDLIKQDEFQPLISEVNELLQKLKTFKQYNISAKFETEIENLLSKVVLLKDEKNRGLHQTSYGVQFQLIITLSILEQLLLIYENASDNDIFDYQETNPDTREIQNKKAISLVLGFDEPEIHLHPYMQRTLAKYLSNIISNKEILFSEILGEIFEIDKIFGQLIIVTHSPNILFNDYKQIIRFYTSENTLKVMSGVTITLGEEEKHLYKLFPLIKEAFFSRCVILVEGDTEPASFPKFAEKMGYDLDELGVSIMSIGGKGHIEKVMELLNGFGIENIALKDSDGDTIFRKNNLYHTVRRDFEEEIVHKIYEKNRQDILFEILGNHSVNLDDEYVQKKDFNKNIEKYKYSLQPITQNQLIYRDFAQFSIDTQKLFLLCILGSKRFKNYLVSKTIGELLLLELIPRIFKLVIAKSIKLANKQ